MAWWDDLKQKAGHLAEKAKEMATDTYDRAELELSVMKIKRSVSLVDTEIKDTYTKMGQRVFELYENEKGPGMGDEELKGYCSEVAGLKKRVAEYEEEIERLRRQEEAENAQQGGEGGGEAEGKRDDD